MALGVYNTVDPRHPSKEIEKSSTASESSSYREFEALK